MDCQTIEALLLEVDELRLRVERANESIRSVLETEREWREHLWAIAWSSPDHTVRFGDIALTLSKGIGWELVISSDPERGETVYRARMRKE